MSVTLTRAPAEKLAKVRSRAPAGRRSKPVRLGGLAEHAPGGTVRRATVLTGVHGDTDCQIEDRSSVGDIVNGDADVSSLYG